MDKKKRKRKPEINNNYYDHASGVTKKSVRPNLGPGGQEWIKSIHSGADLGF